MPSQDTTPSRRIVLSGLVADAPASEMAISLLDEAGKTLYRASVNDDGSCELPAEALASAHGVILEPINVVVEADQFRELIATNEPIDITALLPADVAGPHFYPYPGPTGWPGHPR